MPAQDMQKLLELYRKHGTFLPEELYFNPIFQGIPRKFLSIT